MKQHMGVWLPDGEEHLVAWMSKVNHIVDGKGTYQYHKLEAALQQVTEWGAAIDVGAHCGLWSMHLAQRFGRLYAFEPILEHRDCFRRNVPGSSLPGEPLRGTVQLFPYALGECHDNVTMHTALTSSGDTWIEPGKRGGEVPMLCLDDIGIEQPIGLLKIDVEGYELPVLRGARRLLQTYRPAVIVEQKPGKAQKYGLPETGAVAYLQSLGAQLRATLAGDFILAW